MKKKKTTTNWGRGGDSLYRFTEPLTEDLHHLLTIKAKAKRTDTAKRRMLTLKSKKITNNSLSLGLLV